jgi:thiol-disulfide isomerase/thioredoxin
MNAAPFRSLALCGLLVAVLLPSCEKAKDLAKSFGMKSPPRPPVAYSGSLVTDLDKTNYATFHDQPGRVVLVDFHAKRCGSCIVLAPLLEKIAQENNGLVLVGKVDVDANHDIAAKEGVGGLPDVRVYRDGKLIDKFLGAPGESELRERIQGYTEGLQAVPAAASGGQTTPTPMSKDWLPPGMSRR